MVAPASGRCGIRTGQRPVPPVLMLVVLFGAGCTPVLHRPAQPLATSLQELAPHADGDHFVYVWKQVLDDGAVRAGIHVEHLTALDNGDFEVTLSEDGAVIGYTRFRDDGHALLLLSETLGRNVRLSYDPPLPQLDTPLYAGETRSTATVTVNNLKDDKLLDTLQVTQVVETRAATSVHTSLGDYPHGVQVRTVRTLQFPDGPVELSSTAVLVPGIGEIRSEGAATGAAPLVRELACATIDGRHLGDCHTLRERVEELERAGSTNVP
jgi:hypothetical protein